MGKVALQNYGIHWFRRDLRVDGNPALDEARSRHDGNVLGIFCFDKKFLSRPDFSANRFQFFLDTLSVLKQTLNREGGDLLVLDVGPDSAFETLFAELKSKGLPLPTGFSWNRDYEPFARARDSRIETWLRRERVPVYTERDHVLIEPGEILKPSDPSAPYQVYTPFQKQWLSLFTTPGVRGRLIPARKCPKLRVKWSDLLPQSGPDRLAEYLDKNRPRVTVSIPPAGPAVAKKALASFRPKLARYASDRDLPGVMGTSRLSLFFKNGSLTVAEVISALELKPPSKYLAELIWREFYYYILFHFPHVETLEFQERFRGLKWKNNESHFRAWTEGRTGYPIVDAGMRELKQTGWMHNRVRMIVASFLTKDLLIDWRWGERYFMESLLDGDLAPNNGGWQWAASTGCDAQPYFRIFNPALQSKKFDPGGHYLRKFLPELAHLDDKEIHAPSPLARGKRYPAPIVDHAEQRAEALALYAVK